MTKSHFKIREFDSEKEWKRWRNNFIGASDISAIMGVSPYKKRADILEQKKTKKDQESNEFITSKGHKYEDKMRPVCELLFDCNLPSVCMESLIYKHLACSLDGHNATRNIIWECKLVGEDVLKEVRKTKKPPEKYKFQVQQQLLISNADFCIFFCGTSETDYTHCIVTPDEKVQKQLLDESYKFQEDLENSTGAPPQLEKLVKSLADVKEKLSPLKKQEKVLADEVKKFEFKENFSIDDVSYKRSVSYSEKTDYDKIIKDYNVDVEKYKYKAESVSYLIKKTKTKKEKNK